MKHYQVTMTFPMMSREKPGINNESEIQEFLARQWCWDAGVFWDVQVDVVELTPVTDKATEAASPALDPLVSDVLNTLESATDGVGLSLIDCDSLSGVFIDLILGLTSMDVDLPTRLLELAVKESESLTAQEAALRSLDEYARPNDFSPEVVEKLISSGLAKRANADPTWLVITDAGSACVERMDS